jgi:hypothetical protein
MKKTYLIILLVFTSLSASSQDNRIRHDMEQDDMDVYAFMSMVGFDYHKFEMKSETPAYINVYIDEYLNDKQINHFDHISENKKEVDEAFFNIVFKKLDSTNFTLKLYSLSKNDSIEEIQFRIGDLALFRNLRVNKSEFEYSWKRGNFNLDVGPKIELDKKIPLLFYSTAVTENIDGKTVNAFCDVPNILLNRDEIENKGKIEHYFEIGIELVEQIE